MEIGRKIYYEKNTGNVIVDTGERSGMVVETTIEQDFELFTALAERVHETVGVLQLEYGQFSEDFAQSNGFRVNLETGKLEFSYRGNQPTDPEESPVYQAPLTQRVATLEEDNAALLLELAQVQARQDQADADNAALLLMLAEGGVV
ncbi:hypothetical protein D3C81_309240 [compost metagenome]